ncbi:HAD-IIB family hydrolase [Candidatus Pacebacteria bacterium]|nr:HAD-IIB family hydrolase [Candidatus Paceibacterota bacterium]
MNIKHLFFDMDGTVTPSRSKIDPDMLSFLHSRNETLAVISGSHNKQMQSQIDSLTVIKMGQNGNHVVDSDGTELWYDKLTDKEKSEIMLHAEAVWADCNHVVPDINDLFEDRGSQISLSLYGHHADPAEKKAFDGDFAKRKALLEKFPFISEGLEVKLGGSTCFDYFRKGKNKGHNIDRLITLKNWNKDECLFFGDALFPGGNDETVVDVIETVSVDDPKDCLEKLKFRLS